MSDHLPFSNAHSHIFTSQHAPDYFLRTAIKNDWLARQIDKMVKKDGTRTALKSVDWILKFFSPNYRNTVRRYIEFVQIGTSATQEDVFNMESRAYMRLGDYRIVVLTQVLDYLDYNSTSNHKKIQTQVQEIIELKRNELYHDKLIPFLGIDPRMQGIDLLQWVTSHINKDVGFYGIKIYPAYGFFPFDVRLDPVWKWAAENDVPVMTHATRGGSFYLGTFDSIMNQGGFRIQSLNPNSSAMPRILNRISQLVNESDKSVKKNNETWCNVFGHPDNYIPVLEKYPSLKICLAHLGGANEVKLSAAQQLNPAIKTPYPGYLGGNWYTAILDLMTNFPNVYSDISYTLSDKDAMNIITTYFNNSPLIDKLLYGTDFYLTQQETTGDEPGLINIFLKDFSEAQISKLAYVNPDNYLRSAIQV